MGSSGETAEEFGDSGQMLDVQYKLKLLEARGLVFEDDEQIYYKFNCHILEFPVHYCPRFEWDLCGNFIYFHAAN